MVALLLPITPLYCTSLAFGFYFRVVVTIRARALWLSPFFWLRLDRLIKPCFLPASLLLSLYSKQQNCCNVCIDFIILAISLQGLLL
jgi:hypothetical protein